MIWRISDSCISPLQDTHCVLRPMKKMVMQCGQCKTQTADYFFHHANVNKRTIVPLFSSPKNNSPQSVRSLHFYTAPMQWHIVLQFILLRMFQRIIQ